MFFSTIIRKHEDSTKATLTVAQSFICFLGELEVRRFFIQDFHGSQFNVLPDMSVSRRTLPNFSREMQTYWQSILKQNPVFLHRTRST